MRLFVINLKEAAARRAAAISQLRQAGVEFEIFDAVEGNDTRGKQRLDVDTRLYRLNTLRTAMPAELGCYASHLELWKTCVANNEPIIVLEDDFELASGFSEVVSKVETLIHVFGFIRLETFERRRRFLSHFRKPFYPVSRNSGVELYYLSDVPLCALAYAISPVAARSLINASTTIVGPVDKFLQQTWLHQTPLFGISPAVVRKSRHADASTIGRRQRKSRMPGLLLRRALHKGLGELRRIDFDSKQLIALGIERYRPIFSSETRSGRGDSAGVGRS